MDVAELVEQQEVEAAVAADNAGPGAFAKTHPLFGLVLAASGFKRSNGIVHLVVGLPDGSPGTVRADATDVLGVVTPSGLAVVLDGAGLRELQRRVGG